MTDRLEQVAALMARHPRAEYFRARLAAAAPIESSPAVPPSPAVERGAAGFAATSPAETGGALLPSPGEMGGPPVHPALLNYTDEAVVALGQFMGRNNLTDIETAMVEFERQNPPPEPVVSGATNWNFFAQRDNGADTAYQMLLKGDDEGFLRVSIPAAIESVRGR
jgi:hypothetical protein